MKLEPFDRVREGGVDAPRSSLEEVLERLGRGKPKTEEFLNRNHTPTSAHPNAVGMPAAGDRVGALKFAVQVYNMETSGGIRAEVDNAHWFGRELTVNGSFYEGSEAPGGVKVGHFERTFDGHGSVSHSIMDVESSHQGQGIATEFNAHAEAMYRANGIREIHLDASSTVGGYAWAVAGYDWDGAMPGHLFGQIRGLAGGFELSPTNYDHAITPTQLGTPSLRAKLMTPEVRSEFGQILERLNAGERIAPYEIAQVGRQHAVTKVVDHVNGTLSWEDDPNGEMWAGKALLLGNHWYGVKRLDVAPKVSVNTDAAKAADRARLEAIMKAAKA